MVTFANCTSNVPKEFDSANLYVADPLLKRCSPRCILWTGLKEDNVDWMGGQPYQIDVITI